MAKFAKIFMHQLNFRRYSHRKPYERQKYAVKKFSRPNLKEITK
ncbi:Uncharacterised protein [Serratia fonticola]|nr:hypothetical protein DFO62_110132 [Serratia fonticola]CAI1039900.1 Uncharacterised protein [Serratia fonticola]